MNGTLERFIHGGMLVLSEETPAKEAARAMVERRVGSVVVCNEQGQISGVLTDRDLSSQVLAFGYPPDTPVGELMALEPITITETDTVDTAVRLMEENGIRRVPVVRRLESGKERCIGMVTLDDLLAEGALTTERIAGIVSHQVLKVSRRHLRRDARREARRENTLHRFYKTMISHMRIPAEGSEAAVLFLLTALVQRLPPTGAAHLISQLPGNLQEDLLNLRAGPDRAITTQSLLAELTVRYGLTQKQANQALDGFWDGLEEFTAPSREVGQVLAHLPERARIAW
ncbi:MAG: CBS domain-containing protein [Bdellovibrionales bacterium]|nr:CBS domain-containing protein [Bdellovibrionales bacterium]